VATAKNKHRPAFVTRICRCGCWLLDEERVRGGPVKWAEKITDATASPEGRTVSSMPAM